MKRIIIIGATSAIAQQCARLWLASEPTQMLLVGRDIARLESLAADLRVRSPSSTLACKTLDFLDAAAIARFADETTANGPIDLVLIAHGSMSEQATLQGDPVACERILQINGVSTVLLAEAFATRMERQTSGTLAVIGSVAGDRGRKSNYVYGASKGLVGRYMEGLQHRLAGSGLTISIIKPGPTDTPMTAGYQAKGVKLTPVEDVAEVIVKGLARGQTVIYAPAKWRVIMFVIQHIPSVVFNRLNI